MKVFLRPNVLDYISYLRTAYASPSTVTKAEDMERFQQEILERNGIRENAIVMIFTYAGLRISEWLQLRMGEST